MKGQFTKPSVGTTMEHMNLLKKQTRMKENILQLHQKYSTNLYLIICIERDKDRPNLQTAKRLPLLMMTLIDLMYQRFNHSNFRWYNPTKSVTLETVKFRCGNSQWVCENDNEHLALVLCSLEVFS